MLTLEHLRVDVNSPAFDVLDDGVEVGLLRYFFLGIRLSVGRDRKSAQCHHDKNEQG